ncbi:hypothetical protein J4558_14785 [Leptolyngbya sp. 15MV]|nr:hypothetical protein J4558_14785 [Leptolyngbya sp. 15MV]
MPKRGYAWWYLDALSDDGGHGLTIIAFIGTVFSPWYALARHAQGGTGGDPENHCCLNVVLYGTPSRWAMTDRRRHALRRDATTLTIGPSSLHWDGEWLTVTIREVTAPIPSRLAGTVRLRPNALTPRRFVLDSHGRHEWQPIAPRSRVEVALDSPALRWRGAAYFDTNAGAAPLEQDFREWDWCRAMLPDATAILYNAERRDGSRISLALRATDDGGVADFASSNASPGAAPKPLMPWSMRWRRGPLSQQARCAVSMIFAASRRRRRRQPCSARLGWSDAVVLPRERRRAYFLPSRMLSPLSAARSIDPKMIITGFRVIN